MIDLDPYKGLFSEMESALRVAKVIELEKEIVEGKERLTGRCKIQFLDAAFGERDGVELPFIVVNNQYYFGGIPPIGTLCLVGFGTAKKPYILRYLLPSYREHIRVGFMDALEVGEYVFQGLTGTKVELDKYGTVQFSVREKYKDDVIIEVKLGVIKDKEGIPEKSSQGEEIVGKIETKRVKISIDKKGNVGIEGIEELVANAVETVLKGNSLNLNMLDVGIKAGKIRLGGDIGGVHTSINHPVCLFTGASLVGSPVIRSGD